MDITKFGPEITEPDNVDEITMDKATSINSAIENVVKQIENLQYTNYLQHQQEVDTLVSNFTLLLGTVLPHNVDKDGSKKETYMNELLIRIHRITSSKK